jgi:hypothetical protein
MINYDWDYTISWTFSAWIRKLPPVTFNTSTTLIPYTEPDFIKMMQVFEVNTKFLNQDKNLFTNEKQNHDRDSKGNGTGEL